MLFKYYLLLMIDFQIYETKAKRAKDKYNIIMQEFKESSEGVKLFSQNKKNSSKTNITVPIQKRSTGSIKFIESYDDSSLSEAVNKNKPRRKSKKVIYLL